MEDVWPQAIRLARGRTGCPRGQATSGQIRGAVPLL